MTEKPDESKDDVTNLDDNIELTPAQPLEEPAPDSNDDFEEETFIDFDEEDFDDDFDDDFEDAVEGEYEMEDDEFSDNVPSFNADGTIIKREEEKTDKPDKPE